MSANFDTYPTELPSSAEMALADAAAIQGGVNVATLMERAGAGVAEYAQSLLEHQSKKRILIVCGGGNNGGDGLVTFRLLAAQGMSVEAVICSEGVKSDGCRDQLNRSATRGLFQLEGALIEKLPKLSLADFREKIRAADLVIDALLGTGQSRAPTGLIALAVQSLTDYPGYILSVDVPTGVNPDSGEAYIPAIKATHTLCIERIKRGLMQYPARDYCGEVTCKQIGIAIADTEFALASNANLPALPSRAPNTHKALFGPVLIAAGSDNMPGAAHLSALAALRAGAGLVETTAPVVFSPEIMRVSAQDFNLTRYKAAVVGPGLGHSEEAWQIVQKILANRSKMPVIVDADALTLLAAKQRLDLLEGTVITPHPGEAARILGEDNASVQRDRYATARKLAQITKAIVVLKGAATICYAGARGIVNTTGNSWMSTAGSGDVLTGIIAALVVQGLSKFDAAILSVALHGQCGEIASDGNHPIIASDLIEAIPKAWAQRVVSLSKA